MISRKTGTSKIKLQSIAICPILPTFLTIADENTLNVSNSGKETSFTFDRIVFPSVGLIHDVFGDLTTSLQSIVRMTLLGYDSTVLLYCSHQNTEEVDKSTSRLCLDLLTQLLVEISTSASTFKPLNAVSESISITFCELLDTQIRDLGTDTPTEALRVRELTDNASIIDGLTIHPLLSVESLQDLLEAALERRTVICSGQTDGPSNSTATANSKDLSKLRCKLIGEVGTFIAQVTIKQTVWLSAQHAVKRQVLLRLVSLTPAETLTAAIDSKGYKACVPLRTALRPRRAIPWLAVHEQAALANQLKNSLKALTTLTRVVHSLSKHQDVADVHIPFRDSLLTRLLRSSLHGNCFLSMITVPSAVDAAQASRTLRFAAEISQLYNTIWINEEVFVQVLEDGRSNSGASAAATAAASDGTVAANGAMDAGEHVESQAADLLPDGSFRPQVSSFDKFASLQASMGNEMQQLAAELEALEQLRWTSMSQMHLQLEAINQLPIDSTLPGVALQDMDNQQEFDGINGLLQSTPPRQALQDGSTSSEHALHSSPVGRSSPKPPTSPLKAAGAIAPTSRLSPGQLPPLVASSSSPSTPRQLLHAGGGNQTAGSLFDSPVDSTSSSSKQPQRRGSLTESDRLRSNSIKKQRELEPIRSSTASTATRSMPAGAAVNARQTVRKLSVSSSSSSSAVIAGVGTRSSFQSSSAKVNNGNSILTTSARSPSLPAVDGSKRQPTSGTLTQLHPPILSLPTSASVAEVLLTAGSNVDGASVGGDLYSAQILPPAAVVACDELTHPNNADMEEDRGGTADCVDGQIEQDDAASANSDSDAEDETSDPTSAETSAVAETQTSSSTKAFPALLSTTSPADDVVTVSEEKKSNYSLRTRRIEGVVATEDQDDAGDGLAPAEREFLRYVSTNQVAKAQASLQHGVNVLVKNTFER